jgi:serine/threonine protein kinase
LITTKGIPDLKEPSKWSQHFQNFVSLCLEKDPSQRPDASELLKVRLSPQKDGHIVKVSSHVFFLATQHPFMKTSTGGKGLVEVIDGAKRAAAKNNELLE